MTYILKKLLTSYQHQKPIHKLKHPVENGVSFENWSQFLLLLKNRRVVKEGMGV
jgi:hypothetical protein